MHPLPLRKAVLIATAAGLSLLVIAGIGLGLLKLQNDPRTTSLALRIDASRTQYFLRSSDKDFFAKTITTIAPDASEQLPEADRYEFAVVQSGSGTAWVMTVHMFEDEKNITLVSDNIPSLFLAPGKSKMSLGRTSLLRTYVASQDRNYLWARPTFLPQGTSVVGTVTRAVLTNANAVLFLWEKTEDEGLLIVESARDASYAPTMQAPVREPLAQATLEMGSPERLLQDVTSALEKTDASLADGLRGIVTRILKTQTDSTDLDGMKADLLQGPLTMELFKGKQDGVSVAFSGTARSENTTRVWLERMAATRSAGTQRSISFYEGENVRIDVHTGSGDTLKTMEEKNGWTLMRIGESGATALFAALSGRNYVITTDMDLLPPYDASASQEREDDPSALRGTMDVPWLLLEMEEVAPELAEGIREDMERFVGAHASRIRFSAKPVTHGWRISWSILRSSPATGKLAK